MARRSSSQPLYELIMSRRERGGGAAREPAPPGDPVHPLSPGRAVRVPVGYLMLAVAGGLVLLLIAYLTGATVSARAVRAEYDQRLLEAGASARQPWSASDPLVGAGAGGTGGGPDAGFAGVPAEPAADPEEAPSRLEAAPGPYPGWGPVESEPRVSGRYYLILAETRAEGALRLAGHCRESGLEAYVVAGHNSRLRRVIALPGFASGSMSDPAVLDLLQRVRSIGRAWKAKFPPESDLSDAYLSQYRE